MSKRNVMLGLAAMLSMASGSLANTKGNVMDDLFPKRKEPKRIIPKGCKEFIINGESILALTEERALVKYKKKHNL